MKSKKLYIITKELNFRKIALAFFLYPIILMVNLSFSILTIIISFIPFFNLWWFGKYYIEVWDEDNKNSTSFIEFINLFVKHKKIYVEEEK